MTAGVVTPRAVSRKLIWIVITKYITAVNSDMAQMCPIWRHGNGRRAGAWRSAASPRSCGSQTKAAMNGRNSTAAPYTRKGVRQPAEKPPSTPPRANIATATIDAEPSWMVSHFSRALPWK